MMLPQLAGGLGTDSSIPELQPDRESADGEKIGAPTRANILTNPPPFERMMLIRKPCPTCVQVSRAS